MSKSTNRGSYGKATRATGVSAARLHQKSGTNNSFGGYTKVNKGGGSFTMKPTTSPKRNGR